MDIVVGAGEVGLAIGELISNSGRDVMFHDPAKGKSASGFTCDVLHICFPYSEEFVEQAKQAIDKFKPNLTIIHSTVKVGTTRKVGKDVVYSFVRGKHDKGMAEMMLLNTKHLGCLDKNKMWEATAYLVNLGFETDPYNDPDVVEFGKLWDTTYYGICIAATKMAKEMADSYGLDWSFVAEMNSAYNEGALRFGHPKWVRPELDPLPGKIGGHCIIPNIRILQQDFNHKFLDGVVEAK